MRGNSRQPLIRNLVVVAQRSLVMEAIALGLHECGEVTLVAPERGPQAALEAVRRARPQAVLVEDMDRSEIVLGLIRLISAEDDSTSVIVLTMGMDGAWLEAIFQAGAAGAISKATDPGVLAALVRATLDGQVLHLHRGRSSPPARGPEPVPGQGGLLTPRELEVLQLLASGTTNAEIARRLWVSQQTVKFHLSNVYRKLGVGNRTQATHYAHVAGLVRTLRDLPT